MLPRFSKVNQRTESADTVLLNISWGTLVFGITVSRKPFESNLNNAFDDALYPHQRLRNLVAILLMISVHLLIAWFFLYNKVEQPVKQGEEKGQLVFLDLQPETKPVIIPELPQPTEREKKQPRQPQKKQQRQRTNSKPVIKNRLESPPVKPPASITSQIAAAREKRQALEEQAAQQNKEAQPANNSPSENDLAMARIKANIKAANYNRKGANGIFQIIDKGVQTGRFSFRGWDNDPRQSTWKTYEVDAGVGGDVELALVRRMIAIIREHYSGDFNWESQRLGRVVVLSARPQDTANLERFLMKEFFNTK